MFNGWNNQPPHYYPVQPPILTNPPFPPTDWQHQQPQHQQPQLDQYGGYHVPDPSVYNQPPQAPQQYQYQQPPPGPPQPMPTTRASRRSTDSGSDQYQPAGYSHGAEIADTGRPRRQAAIKTISNSYRGEPAPTAEELGLRDRKSKPNYKEPEIYQDEEEAYIPYAPPAKTRRPTRRVQDSDEDAPFEPDDEIDLLPQASNGVKTEEPVIVSQRGRQVIKKTYAESDDSEGVVPRQRRLVAKSRANADFIASDEEDVKEIEEDADESYGSLNTRQSRRKALEERAQQMRQAKKAARKAQRRPKRNEGSEDDYVEEDDTDDSIGELETHRTTPSPSPSDNESAGARDRAYKLRSRQGQPASYNEIAAFEQMEQNGAGKKSKAKKKSKLNWTGKDYETAWGPLPGQSDSETDFARTPKKAGALPGIPGSGMLAGGAGIPFDVSGTPSNLGKVGDAGLADVDPLGVNANVSFDDVGGLDDHISKLKEMTLLPLLYPDMFQNLGVTPPRGVLFHGPPGTGKTLVARALAASCRSEGRSVSFFMRKGADCLSKWVGEAERQLRLLFEEAKKVQPSIIFLDEIDGLAPVRSSKQDQIHASIVSTLLALMDGMDGRGQVIVIGATNRPDAIDPALRRPGRFDREFYFPLPNFEARLKILSIMTKQWDNWQDAEGDESRKRLARLTKGYGGADLRALCTEAALNAIQRQYPQIYQSSDRLLLDHSKIQVQARDFMISVKEIVPSSARSSATAAAPLPAHLVPLLEGPLEEVKVALDKALPKLTKRSALEEAQWEEDHPDGEAGAFEREIMLQALETQRINRPRLLLYGDSGMGQRAVGAAALHHLEGYTVQSLDLGTLTGDAARTPEAAIVQLFIEAKRHAPSVIYIPSLTALCSALPESCRALVADSLESLDAHEPVVLIAILGGSLKSLPKDVRHWFGRSDSNRILFSHPSESQRRSFFAGLLEYVSKPPNQFPDAVKRRRRILEVLPIAPPLPPREPTPAEVAAQERQDTLLFYKLKGHLNSIFGQCRKADNKFCKVDLGHSFGVIQDDQGNWWGRPKRKEPESAPAPDATADPLNITADGSAPVPDAPPQFEYYRNRLHDVDMARIHDWIWEGRYLSSSEFLRDVALVKANAEMEKNDDDPTTKEMYRRADKVFGIAQEEVGRTEPGFNLECLKMAERFRAKMAKEKEEAEKAAAEKAVTENGIAVDGAEKDPGAVALGINSPPGSEERSLKRSREEDVEMADDGGDRPSKRIRVSPMPEDGVTATAETKTVRFAGVPDIVVNGETSTNAFDPPSPTPVRGEPTLLATHGPMYDPTAVATGADTTMADGTNETSTAVEPLSLSAPTGLTQHVIHTPSRTPSPGPSTPPEFIVSPALMTELENTLAGKTGGLDVEQLIALRAASLDLVWRRRSEWDRDGLMQELIEKVHKYLREMGEESESE